jgi:hypothetical protein
LTCCTLSAQNEAPRVRNIVLVHGAWADGSGWKGVYDILVKDGYNVSIVQEPETSFKEDVAATKLSMSMFTMGIPSLPFFRTIWHPTLPSAC